MRQGTGGGEEPGEVCPEPMEGWEVGEPLAPGIFLSSVYRCADPEQAERSLSGQEDAYVYQRDRHPNADGLADKLRRLHRADWAQVTSSGMAALSAIVFANLAAGQHLIVSRQLYGRSLHLLSQVLPRWGVDVTVLDDLQPEVVRGSLRSTTQMVVAETITNPLLHVTDIGSLAEALKGTGVKLVIDNTLATPCVCQPLELGADLVWESGSKMINGHSDVMLGAVLGRGGTDADCRQAISTWGLASSPFDCWLTARGIATLALRCERACDNARRIAESLQASPRIERVHYPGLPDATGYPVAQRQFRDGLFGSLVTFDLHGHEQVASDFIRACRKIPFCPSLGEVSTTLSHPASTSHRGLSKVEQQRLGISPATIRLSVGTEPFASIRESLEKALRSLDQTT